MFRAAFPGAALEGLGAVSRRVISCSSSSSVSLRTPRRWFEIAARPKLLLYSSRAIQVLRDGMVQTSSCGSCAAKKLKVPLVSPASKLAGDLDYSVRPRLKRATFGWLGDQDSNLD